MRLSNSRFPAARGGFVPPALAALLVSGLTASLAHAVPVGITVTFTNTSPAGGVGTSPLWVGFHNGSFDVFDPGTAVSAGVRSTAEDGSNTAIMGLFTGNGVQGTLPGGPAFPGATRMASFTVDTAGPGRYFSYASMVVVSNDFFIANANPLGIDLSTLAPNQTLSFLVGVPYAAGLSNVVFDAGTEVNDFAFSLANGAFGIPGGQTGPNQGTAQGGVATAVSASSPFAGFLNTPAGGVSASLNFNNAALYTSIGRIDITSVPEPASLLLLGGGLLALSGVRGRRQASSPG